MTSENGSYTIDIIGGGLAGSEAAWQVAQAGYQVNLYEMRPVVQTGAHVGEDLAELVCSNSLGSNLPDRASGLLKNELRMLNSLLINIAEKTAVPAGGALAVDRRAFSQGVTSMLAGHESINIIRQEMHDIPHGPTIIASGPLTSDALSDEIKMLAGSAHLFFYDAISPIVNFESINMEVAFRASRYERGTEEEGDYINCPLDKDEYDRFIDALANAERIELKSFELDLQEGVRAGIHTFFEGCLPVEILAQRGHDSLAYGPLRPVGLRDPRTGKRPHAVVQLRQDDLHGALYNIVGFQTNLTFPEQRRVLRMIPGLENASFERYGQMHRNTFIHSPSLLRQTLQFLDRDDLFFAGQITGVEGYAGNIATGLLAGINIVRQMNGQSLFTLPETTMLGALCHYITHASSSDFQPMKANFGIMPELQDQKRRNKRQRAEAYAHRALADLEMYLRQQEWPVRSVP